MTDYAGRSFGVYQGEAFETVWRFSPAAAMSAAEYVFHPHQVMETQADGSFLVRFTAAGELEMAWHLYAWGTEVEVLSPPSLAAMFHALGNGFLEAITFRVPQKAWRPEEDKTGHRWRVAISL